MHTRRNLLIAALVAAVVTAFWLSLRPPPALAPSAPVVVTKPPRARAAAPATVPPPAVPEPTPSAAPPDTSAATAANETEQIATARMIAAHASLRTPDVADPDSVQNRQALQIMVAKALASQPVSSPAATLSPQSLGSSLPRP